MQISGYFTVQNTSQRYLAALLIDEPNQPSGQLLLAIDGQDAMESVLIADVSQMIAGADWRITLAGRGVFTLSAPLLPDELEPFLPKTAKSGRLIGLAERLGWRSMFVAVGLIIACLIGIRAGLPVVGDHLSRYVPESWAKGTGKTTLSQLDYLFLAPSQLSRAERHRIDRLFADITAQLPADAPPVELVYRSAPTVGPNAFALPGNIVVLLDEMVEFADSEDVLVAVLAHEVGHVTNRHAMRLISRSAIVAFSVGLVFGIEDSFVEEIATLGSSLTLSSYSRSFELEADRISSQIMRQLGRDPKSLTKLFDKLADECGPACAESGFFATHPSFAERRAQLE